ncbi:GspE/PulE family protein [Pararobbsia alpina]|uniref:Type II secretion system protein E n=1 Tax=Pararobbsia alpina TaxID=621374 RepID=A0A6S7AW79_9BURK|nr:ATPase, T2SS/T4P/T4SS family [Pararobbsia alpina]CAB3777562.1 Type II secretion system protein E [Pararobbsia alpina]
MDDFDFPPPPASRTVLSSHHLTILTSVDDAADSPAARLLRDVLLDAAERRASDIHIEPDVGGWRIRLRIDGVLHQTARPAASLCDPFVTRIKVLSRIDIAERRIPQDGRLRIRIRPSKIEEYRVSTLPTLFGEKVVLRRLDSLPEELSLQALGLEPEQQATISQAIRAPHGLLLVTGPTGSGKTLSLYCFMQYLNSISSNLCSVEDPAEIQLAGLNQVNIREKAGLTFATALRALLRQDPDVVMIGEIRDRETADVAVKAALTGHLVLSTLHTNDAPATLARLLDIGIEPHNLAAAIRLITAQRLVRRLCPACREPYLADADSLRAAGFDDADIAQIEPLYRPIGCEQCHQIGYRGRVGIHQVMPMTSVLRSQIVEHGVGRAFAEDVARSRLPTLRDAALLKVRRGETSLEAAVAATEFDA